MVTYYQGRAALITHSFFQRGWPDPERFRLGELHDIEISVGRAGPPEGRALALIGMLVIAIMTGWPVFEGAPVWVEIALVLAVASSAWSGACLRRRARLVWELRAVYRGRAVVLMRTRDERTFGQVRRALIRALEARRRAAQGFGEHGTTN